MIKISKPIPSSIVISQVACKYFCWNNCLVLVLTLCLSLVKKKRIWS